MTIREYFEMILDTLGWDAYCEAECAAWDACCEDDSTAWEAWMAAHPEIDFDAMEDGYTVVTLWGWDMCGD